MNPATSSSGDYNYGTADIVAPTITGQSFVVEAPRMAVRFNISEDVGASLAPVDVTVQPLPSGANVPAANIAVSFDPATNVATFTFPGYAGGVLPDGNYRATLGAGAIADSSGNVNAAAASVDFFSLAGDANADRTVNLTDFTLLAANFNGSGKTHAQGDFNYDTVVDLTDFHDAGGELQQDPRRPRGVGDGDADVCGGGRAGCERVLR